MKYPFLILFALSISSLSAQKLILKNSIPVVENGDTLTSAFAGGFNQPQFSAIELNGDSLMDLIVFDRSGDKILPFVNAGGPGQMDYRYAEEYASSFPEIFHWMLTRDYNCDGKMDLFCYGKGVSTIAVYRNDSDANGLAFTQVQGQLMDEALGEPIAVLSRDLPGIADIDGDGDLDILAFDFGGLYVELHQNQSVENGFGCDSLLFEKTSSCWGEFQENGLNNSVTLQVSCKGTTAGKTSEHSGSTISVFDYEGDGVKEVVLGDIGAGNLVYLHNGGTQTTAQIDGFSYTFPDAAPVSLEIFPAAFFLDLDLDGKDEMIVAPNAPNISANFQNVWLYENIGIGDTNEFDFLTKSFLSVQMIECGMSSHPVFFDYNGDGLLDLLVGNQHYKSLSTNEIGALTLYRNTGTATGPIYTLESRDYLGLSAFFNPPEIGLSPALGDMDGDGDADMVLGTSTGKMHYFQNDPVGDSSVFTLQTFNMFGLDVGQGATPEIFDLDEDGAPDLIVGENAGNFNFFRNSGSASQMAFAMPPDENRLGAINIGGGFTGYSSGRMRRNGIQKPEFFVGGEPGMILRYNNIEGRIYRNYFLADTAYGGIDVGSNIAFDMADIDGDGKYEFAVGNLRGGVAIYDAAISTAIEDDEISSFSRDFVAHQEGEQLKLRFMGESFRRAEVRLYDMQGRMISMDKIPFYTSSFFLKAAAVPGMYLLRVNMDGQDLPGKKVFIRE